MSLNPQGELLMNIESTIERFILDELLLGAGPEKIGLHEPLIGGSILDSLALLRLITFIEERFDIVIQDVELVPENFQTIYHIKSLLESKQLVS
jgi:acyl carrier protein